VSNAEYIAALAVHIAAVAVVAAVAVYMVVIEPIARRIARR
jgi:hypothetical protein